MIYLHLPQFDEDRTFDVCGYPIYNNEFTGLISHVEPPNTVYIQNASYTQHEQQFLNELFEAYEHNGNFEF